MLGTRTDERGQHLDATGPVGDTKSLSGRTHEADRQEYSISLWQEPRKIRKSDGCSDITA